MLVTMQNSALIDKLLVIADGDIELVQKAIRSAAGGEEAADLNKVVKYIITNRKRRVMRAPSSMAVVA